MYHGSELISKFVPEDNCRQTPSLALLENVLKINVPGIVLDLGCGEGNTVDFFRKINPQIRWIGLDIASSQEVLRRRRSDAEFHTYDGVNIPFQDDYFDMIYCHQVFEHVHNPFDLMKEISRTLKPGGILVGSTSQMEAFHSESTYNYTPYGFSLLLENSQLQFVELRPGIDVITLLVSRLFNGSKFLSRITGYFFKSESPLNIMLNIAGKLLGKSKREINLLKLLFCGQFSFFIKKSVALENNTK